MNYIVLDHGNLVLESWVGTISHEEVMSHERRHMQDPSIRAGASVLADATGAIFETTPEKIHEVTELYRRPRGQRRIGKCAVLVNREAYDRVRLYEKQAAPYGVVVIVFNLLNTACRWLGVETNIVRKELNAIKPRLGSAEVPSNAL